MKLLPFKFTLQNCHDIYWVSNYIDPIILQYYDLFYAINEEIYNNEYN